MRSPWRPPPGGTARHFGSAGTPRAMKPRAACTKGQRGTLGDSADLVAARVRLSYVAPEAGNVCYRTTLELAQPCSPQCCGPGCRSSTCQQIAGTMPGGARSSRPRSRLSGSARSGLMPGSPIAAPPSLPRGWLRSVLATELRADPCIDRHGIPPGVRRGPTHCGNERPGRSGLHRQQRSASAAEEPAPPHAKPPGH